MWAIIVPPAKRISIAFRWRAVDDMIFQGDPEPLPLLDPHMDADAKTVPARKSSNKTNTYVQERAHSQTNCE